MTIRGSGSDERRGRRRPAPRPWVPAFARTTMGECGSAGAAGGGRRPAPAPARGACGPRSPFDFPQGERPPRPRMALSRWVPACAGITRGGGVREGRGTREPRPSPRPWIPAFAGTTMWVGVSAGAAGGVGVRVSLRRDGRFAKRPYDGVWSRRGCDGGEGGGVARVTLLVGGSSGR